MTQNLTFARLTQVDPSEIVEHMSDPRVAEHMPLLTSAWDRDDVQAFIKRKEAHWQAHGLGHWAILEGERYVGWGGFEKEGDEWDFGLVLRPDCFGLGPQIAKKAIEFAIADKRIPSVTFLLAPTRRNLSAFDRLGADAVGKVEIGGAKFVKYRLDTSQASEG